MTSANFRLRARALMGSKQEIRRQLAGLGSSYMVVLPLDHVRAVDIQWTVEALINFSAIAPELVRDRSQHFVDQLTHALLPSEPVSPLLMREAAMQIKARTAVLVSGDLLTATEVAKLAGLGNRNRSAQPYKWKTQGKIFAVPHNGIDHFPGYGLDPNRAYRPRAALADVLKVFGESKDGWGLAYWFASLNSFLGGKRPQDVLKVKPNRVVAAAEEEMAQTRVGLVGCGQQTYQTD